MANAHPITKYLQSLSTKKLIDADFNVLSLSEQIYRDFEEEFSEPSQLLALKILFIQQTSRIIYNVGQASPADIDRVFTDALISEVYHSINHAKMLRCELSKKDVSEYTLNDILVNFEALSDSENEFEIEARSAKQRHLPVFNQERLVKMDKFVVLCANANSGEQIMAAENHKIDPKSNDSVQRELNKIRLKLSEMEHWRIFGQVKKAKGPFYLPSEKIQQFFHSHRGVLSAEQWDKIYRKLSPKLQSQYFVKVSGRYQLKGITERQFLDELVHKKIDIKLSLSHAQRRKMLNRLSFEQLIHYGELVFNTRISDYSSTSRAKFEMAHKFGFNAGAVVRGLSSVLSLGLEHLGAIAQAKLVFGLYGLHGEVMKGHSKNKSDRKKYVDRCIKLNRANKQIEEMEKNIIDLQRELSWNRDRLTNEIIDLVTRANYHNWLVGIHENTDSTSKLQTVIDIILSRQRELNAVRESRNKDRVVLASFCDYLQKHKDQSSGLYCVADQSYQEPIKLSGIAGFLASAYETVTPQLAIFLNMIDFGFKAVLMTLAISAVLALVVPETTSVLILTGISAGISFILSVNKYYRMRNDYNSGRILDNEKQAGIAQRVGIEHVNREKYALKFFVKTMANEGPGGINVARTRTDQMRMNN